VVDAHFRLFPVATALPARAVACRWSPGGPPAPASAARSIICISKITGGVFLEALQHGLKHLEGFFFVLDQRIVLAVPRRPDAFFQWSMLSSDSSTVSQER